MDGENKMKKFWVATVGLLAIGMAAPASAADLAARPYVKAPPAPVVPIYDWSGFYIGADGGGAWSRKCWDVTNFRGPVVFGEGCHDASGGVVGGQIGYRWQTAGWVFGIEAQGDWADLKGSNVSLFIPAWTNNSRIEALGLFTGQVGYAWNNVLWYVKGGAAVTDDRYRGTVTATGALFDSANETRWGGVVGTGLEYGFAPNWSVGIEYFSWVTAASPPHRSAFWPASRPAPFSAPTRSVRTLIWSLRASTTASTGVARSSRGTD
jgi:outer membrane immunogenic protein